MHVLLLFRCVHASRLSGAGVREGAAKVNGCIRAWNAG